MHDSKRLPKIVISLDFEMRFGVHDLYGSNLSGYYLQLSNEVLAAEMILRHFKKNKIRSTWATVGALACDDWDEYFSRSPEVPSYQLEDLKFKKEYSKLDPKGELHFCPQIVKKISVTEGQDLGSHTFSHLFLQEEGVSKNDFINDAIAVKKIFEEKYSITPVSFVFPRNQFNFLDSLPLTPYKIWRANEPVWYYDCNSKKNNKNLPRALRLIDSVFPLKSYPDLSTNHQVTYSSQFLRFNLPSKMWDLHLLKFRRGISSLKNNERFHLWWHPHNLGSDLIRSEERLIEVIEIIKNEEFKKNIESINMRDLIYE
jgi:hypothetical protein